MRRANVLPELRETALSDAMSQVELLPLEDFLSWVADQWESWSGFNLDPGSDSYMFHFARFIKAHPEAREMRGDAILPLVEAALSVVLHDPWEVFQVSDADDARLEFLYLWDLVRLPAGWDLLDWALHLSKGFQSVEHPVDGYRRFLALVAAIVRVMGRSEIALPEEAIGARLGVSAKSVSRYRALAQRDGYIRLTRKHSAGQAACFQVDPTTFGKWRDVK